MAIWSRRGESGFLVKIRRTACLLLGRGVEISKETWDREYEEGQWAYLHGLDQLPRYCVVAGYMGRLRPNASVLEVGCGDGILQRLLAPAGYARYVGIDLSERAIEVASRATSDARATFRQCDAAQWEPTETFDVIVFNETLYYFHQPVEVLRRYERALAKDGFFVVSMYWRGGTMQAIWKNAARVYICLHQTQVVCGLGKRSLVRVLGRRGTTLAAVSKGR